MATVWIPAPMRDLTGDRETVVVPGATVREVIDELNRLHPGIRERLCQGDVLRSGIAVFVNTELARLALLEPVSPDAEVHFLPAIAGG
jgi:molybdopterin synthase sulfur carrier subunit